MAKVSLRLYNREIEKLIDGSQIEEAIAHCKYILQSFPKHVETYRLLGKAYLENQRYGEATDIFQRVLASTPDDFVSHIGLSIIREDEGNLDAAIWHMERAYEVQPSNGAIQDELRRLHGRRDGIEPPRIRLTRGALVRMYARGDLYQQAIAEIRALLSEDPQRSDVQALLAKMCYLSGKKVEATEVCGELLNKYPYCFEANRILAEILPGTSRAEDAKIYRQRVNSLDPYYAFTSAEKPLSAEIPDNAVIIERLDWQAYEEGGQNQPKWAESLGINLEESGVKPQPVPEWMANPEEPQPQVESPSAKAANSAPVDSATAPTQAPSSSDNVIPDWMRDSGWTEASEASGTSESAAEQGTPLAGAGNEEEIEGEVKPGAIPDWLQALAPDVPLDVQNAPVDKDFESLFSTISSDQAQPEEPVQHEPAQEEASPTWQVQDASTLEMPAVQSVEKTEDASSMPDWLKDLKAEPTPRAEEELPAWLKDIQPATTETTPSQPGQTDVTPQWLHEIEEASPDNAPAGIPAVEAPTDQIVERPSPAQTTVLPLAEAETPDWLKDLTAPQDSADETLAIQPDDRIASISSWVQEAQETPPAPTAPAEPAPESEALPQDKLPDWLKSIAPEQPVDMQETAPTATVPVEPEPEREALPQNELPDWFKDIEPAQPETTPPVLTPGEQPPTESLSDWLKTLKPIDQGEPAAQSQSVPGQEPLPAASLPDWLANEEPAVAQESMIEQPPAADNAAPAKQTGSLDNWLQKFEEAPSADTPTQPVKVNAAAPAVEPELPPTPTAIEPETPSDQNAVQAVPEAPAVSPEDNLPDWLKGLGAPQAEELTAPEKPEEPLPDWLAELKTGQEPKAPADIKATPDQDAALAWLEGLAAKQGADEETLFVKPEDRKEEPPTWVQQATAQAAETAGTAETTQEPTTPLPTAEQTVKTPLAAETTPPVEEAASSLPDWLKEFTPAEEVEPETPAISSQEITPAAEAPAETAPETTPAGKTLPDWLQDLKETPAPEAQAPAATAPSSLTGLSMGDEDAALAWLESLAAKHGADEETLFVKPEERLETPPTWVQEAATQTQVPAISETPVQSPVEEPTAELELGAREEPAPESLVSMEQPAAAAETTPPAETVETAPSTPVSVEPQPPAQAAAVPSDKDAALAWLEGLAAKHGAEEETLFVKPEDRQEAPPAWVQAVTPASGETTGVGAPPPLLETVLMSESDIVIPTKASSEAITETQAAPIMDTAAVEEEQPAMAVESAPTAEPAPAVETSDTILPDWLKGFESEETEAPTQPVQINPPLTQVETGETATVPLTETPQPVEDKPIWLSEFERSEGQKTGLAQPVEKQTQPPASASVSPTDETVAIKRPATPPQVTFSVPETAFPPIEKPAAVQGNWQEVLAQAQAALDEGQVIAALQNYNHLIDSGQLIEEAIHDLRDALYHYPVEVTIWQALGDAYVRTNRLQDALDAYTKAEELLR